MFTENFYNLMEWKSLNYNSDSGNNPTWNEATKKTFRVSDYNDLVYYIYSGSSQVSNANTYIKSMYVDLFRIGNIFLGHAETVQEFNNSRPYDTMLTRINGSNTGSLVGDDKKYYEYDVSATYRNNSANNVIVNKLTYDCDLYGYWALVNASFADSAWNLRSCLLREQIENPIEMAIGEVRRFTYKLRFPLFY